MKALADRFWEKVVDVGTTGCWTWTASTSRGYGKIDVDGKTRIATHVALFLDTGRWPKKFVLHKCDNPACVRPDHLYEGTRKQNGTDAVTRGRTSRGEHRWSAKLSAKDVEVIRAAPYYRGLQRALAKRYGVGESAISLIRSGVKWPHATGPISKTDRRQKAA